MSQQIEYRPVEVIAGDVAMASPDFAAADAEQGGLPHFDLQAIIAAVRRNLIAICAIIAGALALGVVVTLLLVPQFVATSRVLIEQQTDQIIESETVAPQAAAQDADRFLQTQVDIIRSRAIAERVVESENLASSEEFFEAQGAELPTQDDVVGGANAAKELDRMREEMAIELFQENLRVDLPLDSRLVSIGFQSASARMAANLANATAENFIESNLARKFDSSAYAREFLSQQLTEARAKLEQSERNLNQYSRAAGLIRVAGQGTNADQETTLSVTNETLTQINSAASLATAQRIEAEKRWNSISRAPLMSVPQVLQNSAVQDFLRQRAEIEAKLADERQRHLEDHPNVRALEAQVREINEQIQSVGNSIRRAVRVEYDAALDRENSLKSQVSGLRSAALDEQDRGVQYNVLKREAETDRALYNTLLTRFNEINATAGATSNNVSMVDEAQPPSKPSFPNPIINILMALLSGIVLAVAFVFLREQFDDVTRSPDDVERKLGLTLLGLIPRSEGESPTEELQDPKSPISEAYQSLVTNLRYSSSGGIPHTLTITSAQASEGKTTSANQLAREFAELGKRTLLIDADLRHPTLHRKLANEKQEGLTTLLAGERTVDEVLVASDHPNLSYISALPIPPDPAALLNSSRVAELIEDLSGRFDCVVFDAPPMLGLTDAATLAAHCDGVLLVVDSTSGRRGAVKAAMRRLAMVRAKIIGAVLTKFDARKAGGAYSYYGTDYYTYEAKEK